MRLWATLVRGSGALLVGLGLAVAAPALAQDDGGFSFELNSVLVATFEADQPFLESEAERVRVLVEQALGEAYVVVRMPEVPEFTDYSADTYLRSCPPGQYIGCVFVVGGRAKTDWTVGGRVTAVDGGYQAFLSFIDVDEAKLVLEFDVVLDGTNDVSFQDGVRKIMDALVSGEVQALDVRADPEAERAKQAEEEERQKKAKQFALDSVYEDPEDLDRGTVGRDAYASDRTDLDLDAVEGRSGLEPWERAGLTKAQYKLYRKSGLKLRDFKERLKGRKGQFLARLGMIVGVGPYGQEHENYFVQANTADPADLRPRDILDQSAASRQARRLALGGELELGFGLTPWLELMVFGGIRQASYEYRYYREVDGGSTPGPGPYTEAVARTFHGGLRVGVVPLPAYPVRPTFHVGASFWAGTAPSRVTEPASYLLSSVMPGNNLVLIHVNPGFEVSAGKLLAVYGRFDVDIPILGRSSQFFNDTDPDIGQLLSVRPSPDSVLGPGFGGSIGLLVRVPLRRK